MKCVRVRSNYVRHGDLFVSLSRSSVFYSSHGVKEFVRKRCLYNLDTITPIRRFVFHAIVPSNECSWAFDLQHDTQITLTIFHRYTSNDTHQTIVVSRGFHFHTDSKYGDLTVGVRRSPTAPHGKNLVIQRYLFF